MNIKEIIQEIKRINPIHFFDFGTKIKTSAKGYLISSPLRKDEKPSLSFFLTKKNEWLFKDLATGETFDLIDFIRRYYGISFIEAIEKITGKNIKIQVKSFKYTENSHSISDNKTSVIYKDKVKTERLKKYLKKRKIFKIPPFLKEINFKVRSRDGTYKTYYGIGIQNNQKSYEVRTIYFKTVIGKKSIFYHDNNNDITFIGEGMFDIFSIYQLCPDFNFVSFNSVVNINENNLKKIKHLIENKTVIIGFDNDQAGKEANKKLIVLLKKMNFNFKKLILLTDNYSQIGLNIFSFKIYPSNKDIKDINELFMKNEITLLKKTLEKITQKKIDFFLTLSNQSSIHNYKFPS